MQSYPKIYKTRNPVTMWFVQAWEKMTRLLQARVEHMRITNAEATDLIDGELLYLTTGVENVLRTAAVTEAEATFAAVSCEPTAAGGRGVARTSGLAWVLFEPNLVPAPAGGEAAYTCATKGRASNVPPLAGFYSRIGTIEDASTYATQGGCYVNISHCCSPSENRA